MALRDPATGKFQIDKGDNVPSGHEHWLIKLKHRKEGSETGRIEYAYAQMSKAAGIDFPDTVLITDRQGSSHFAVSRFDRAKPGRLHTHTLAGLLHADFRMPSLDYEDLLKVTRILTDNQAQVEEAFRRMLFNVIAGNRDDHAKNHAFLMDNAWTMGALAGLRTSPPSEGPGGEHNMTIAGEGRTPGPDHIAKIAAKAEMRPAIAQNIIDQVTEAIHHGEVALMIAV